MATAAETDGSPQPRAGRGSGRRGRPASGPDRLTVGLLTLAAFLVVLSLLASQLRPAFRTGPVRHVLVTRRIYRTTTVVESRTPSGTTPGDASVSQSVSSSGASGAAYGAGSAPVTRSS